MRDCQYFFSKTSPDFYFPSQIEKNYAHVFSKTRTAIEHFAVREFIPATLALYSFHTFDRNQGTKGQRTSLPFSSSTPLPPMIKYSMETIRIQHYQSPCGDLILGSYGHQLCMCDWAHKERKEIIDTGLQKRLCSSYEIALSPVLKETIAQLDEYFSHKRETFDIPLLMAGTEFQQTVWGELLNIPYGTTISYATLARRIGNPKAVRAVARANGANPISILVPCHRVIGSDNTLTGYGGGLDKKEFLLRHEMSLPV